MSERRASMITNSHGNVGPVLLKEIWIVQVPAVGTGLPSARVMILFFVEMAGCG